MVEQVQIQREEVRVAVAPVYLGWDILEEVEDDELFGLESFNSESDLDEVARRSLSLSGVIMFVTAILWLMNYRMVNL